VRPDSWRILWRRNGGDPWICPEEALSRAAEILVNQFRPFQMLYFAVTGKMVGGTVVNTHTVSRESALIAHTRSNAYLFFRENDLGSIQAGRFADLVVTDRDYMTVPADQIKDIRPVMTMVGGRVVFDAAAESATATR